MIIDQRWAGALLRTREIVGPGANSSFAMMVARVVLPSPGGPKSKTWSSASPRDRAASRAMPSCSFAFSWPMNSCRRRGRSFSSNEESSSTGAAETSRSFVCVGRWSAGLSLAADTEGDGKAKSGIKQLPVRRLCGSLLHRTGESPVPTQATTARSRPAARP